MVYSVRIFFSECYQKYFENFRLKNEVINKIVICQNIILCWSNEIFSSVPKIQFWRTIHVISMKINGRSNRFSTIIFLFIPPTNETNISKMEIFFKWGLKSV